jgi:hypothetical protein
VVSAFRHRRSLVGLCDAADHVLSDRAGIPDGSGTFLSTYTNLPGLSAPSATRLDAGTVASADGQTSTVAGSRTPISDPLQRIPGAAGTSLPLLECTGGEVGGLPVGWGERERTPTVRREPSRIVAQRKHPNCKSVYAPTRPQGRVNGRYRGAAPESHPA